MKIRFIDNQKSAEKYLPKSNNPYRQRYGAWGIVNDIHSEDHSADINLDYGPYIDHVPVSCREWVKPGDEYTSGERNLPPKGARVFVMMPTGTLDDCFILCSGLTPFDQDHKESFMQKQKESERHKVTPGNWKTKYQYEDGSYGAVSPDEKTSINIDYSKEDPELNITLFAKIVMKIVSLKSFFFSLFDTADVTIKKDEITINSPKVKHTIDGDKIEDINGKFYFGNNSQNAAKLLIGLIDEITTIGTVGSSSSQAVNPASIAKLQAYKEQVKALYKESKG